MLGAFILFVLYLTGLIETAVQLFGAGNVSNNCQRYVNNNPISGVSASTLAWLEQNSICESEILLANADCLTDTLRLKLVRSIQLLDSGHCFLHLDVDNVFASRKGCVRPSCLGELVTAWLYL